MFDFKTAEEKIAKINLLSMNATQLSIWLRSEKGLDFSNSKITVLQTLMIAKLILEAHRLGVIRGQATSK